MSHRNGLIEVHDIEYELELRIRELTDTIANLNTPIERVESLRWVLRSLNNTLAFVKRETPVIELI